MKPTVIACAAHLRAFAKDPHLIETDEQLATLRSHVADCQECATLLGRALEFDVHVVGPLRKTWDHLATRRLKALKATGFVPTAASAISVDQWHVLVCPACRRRYHQLG